MHQSSLWTLLMMNNSARLILREVNSTEAGKWERHQLYKLNCPKSKQPEELSRNKLEGRDKTVFQVASRRLRLKNSRVNSKESSAPAPSDRLTHLSKLINLSRSGIQLTVKQLWTTELRIKSIPALWLVRDPSEIKIILPTRTNPSKNGRATMR